MTEKRGHVEVDATLEGVQWRAAGDGSDHMNVIGHAAVFNQLSDNLGGFREIIDPSAFDEVLGTNPDVRLLINHDPNRVLARSTAGTLRMSVDGQGLAMSARIPSALSYAQDLRVQMESGLVNQMSFAFDIGAEERDGEVDGVPVYRVTRASNLYDNSFVTYPAYPQTDASLVRMRMASPLTRERGGDDDNPSDIPAVVPPTVDLERKRELRRLRARGRLLVVQFQPIG